MTKSAYAVLLPLLTGCMLLRAAVSPEETQKQDEFKKAYKSADKAERQKAVQLLSGLASPSTLNLLVNCCNGDTDKDVRADAFQLLAKAPAHDSSVAQTLGSIFQAVKDQELQQRFAGYMISSEFKYPIGAALASVCSQLRYPDLSKIAAPKVVPKTPQSDQNDKINKERNVFFTLFTAFNGVTGAGLPGPDKNSPSEVKKWWDANSSKIKKADAEKAAAAKTEPKKEDPPGAK